MMNQRNHIPEHRAEKTLRQSLWACMGPSDLASSSHLWGSEQSPAPNGNEEPLEEVVREERDYVRERLREEMEREPTEEEVDEWLRHHTEGY